MQFRCKHTFLRLRMRLQWIPCGKSSIWRQSSRLSLEAIPRIATTIAMRKMERVEVVGGRSCLRSAGSRRRLTLLTWPAGTTVKPAPNVLLTMCWEKLPRLLQLRPLASDQIRPPSWGQVWLLQPRVVLLRPAVLRAAFSSPPRRAASRGASRHAGSICL